MQQQSITASSTAPTCGTYRIIQPVSSICGLSTLKINTLLFQSLLNYTINININFKRTKSKFGAVRHY